MAEILISQKVIRAFQNAGCNADGTVRLPLAGAGNPATSTRTVTVEQWHAAIEWFKGQHSELSRSKVGRLAAALGLPTGADTPLDHFLEALKHNFTEREYR